MPIEHSLVNITPFQAQRLAANFYEGLVPTSTALLQVVDRFPQTKDFSSSIWEGKAGRLAHVDLLIVVELTVWVCTFNINLMNFEIKLCSECEDSMNGCKLCNWCVCVEVINSLDL